MYLKMTKGVDDLEALQIPHEDKNMNDEYLFVTELLSKDSNLLKEIITGNREREIFLKFYRDDMTHEEISKEMGCGVSTSSGSLAKAMKSIRNYIKLEASNINS